MLTVGLVGLGSISRQHLRGYVESGLVRHVKGADPSPQVREAAAREFGIIRTVYDSMEALLDDPEVDVVDICTPHYLHKPQAVAALEAGKHVILEKPMAMNVAECDEILAAASASGRRVFVALCQRMFPAHIKAKQLVNEGAIGQPFLGVINVYGNAFEWMNDPTSWKGDWEKAGGGALVDTGHHAVYMLQHFFGPAAAVTAAAKRLLVEPENKADDTAVAALELPGPALGSIVVTYCATGDRWTEERRIVGTDGSLLIRDYPADDMPLLLLRGNDIIPVKVSGPLDTHGYGIARIIEHFLDCIVHDKPEEVTAQEARAAVATCQAAYVSEREGRRVVVQY
ncbi:MAG: Gfo/Idh/MocA family oxidoreductase [Armatimonadetes bacterium]|nr:Gfo/Idh/MocA family oxidoreductase [Armatimonadota bacterium]